MSKLGRITELHSTRAWMVLVGVWVILALLVPLVSTGTASGTSALGGPGLLLLVGKFACYAMVAIAIDLIWGYCGILSLGHGVFFALGGYCMGMNLMLSIAGQGVYRSRLPDFMVFLDWKDLPWFWRGFDNFAFALVMALVVPSTLALAVGYLAFRSRIRGVYLSLITQALTLAMMLLFFRNETGFGGNNGLTDFKTVYGYPLAATSTRLGLYWLAIVMLLVVYLGTRFLVCSPFGAVLRAIRDVESKARFCGHNTLHYKLTAWTVSAAICGLAGAIYVPLVGIINPSEMQPANSIEMVIWVAIGGRGTLGGAALGAALINGLKSWFTGLAPSAWLYILGALFVGVTLVLPDGLVSVKRRFATAARGDGS